VTLSLASIGAPAPVGRPLGGPTARPLRGFPAVLGAGRPANNSPSNTTARSCTHQARSSNSICGTPLRGATFRPLRSSASHTGRQGACPQGLLPHQGLLRELQPPLPQALSARHERPSALTTRRTDATTAATRIVNALGGCSRCGVAFRRPVCAAEERRGWKVAPRSGVPQMLFELRAWRQAGALGGPSRASYLGAFQPRAPQGTPEGGKQSGRRKATPHRPARAANAGTKRHSTGRKAA
jgi:hypothetical protein